MRIIVTERNQFQNMYTIFLFVLTSKRYWYISYVLKLIFYNKIRLNCDFTRSKHIFWFSLINQSIYLPWFLFIYKLECIFYTFNLKGYIADSKKSAIIYIYLLISYIIMRRKIITFIFKFKNLTTKMVFSKIIFMYII